VTDSLPKGYQAWLIACTSVLVGSLILLAVAVTAAFVTFADVSAPLWDVVLGVVAVLGIVAGFGGLMLMLVVAGYRSFREGRKVQVISPAHADGDGTKS
jgi:hypothetical protein